MARIKSYEACVEEARVRELHRFLPNVHSPSDLLLWSWAMLEMFATSLRVVAGRSLHHDE
jgi:hypothetical protein